MPDRRELDDEEEGGDRHDKVTGAPDSETGTQMLLSVIIRNREWLLEHGTNVVVSIQSH